MSIHIQLEAALREAKKGQSRLSSSVKSRANAMLVKVGFGGKGRFSSIGDALGKISAVLRKQGIDVTGPNVAMDFSKSEGRKSLDVEFVNKDDPSSPIPISNSALSFGWYAMTKDGGKVFEIVAYLG